MTLVPQPTCLRVRDFTAMPSSVLAEPQMSPWFHSDTFTVALAVTASYKPRMKDTQTSTESDSRKIVKIQESL